MAILSALDNPYRSKRQWVSEKKTRRSPDIQAAGADIHGLPARPSNFSSWWAWGVEQGQALQQTPVDRIHIALIRKHKISRKRMPKRPPAGSGYPADAPAPPVNAGAIPGMPFARPFTSYVDRFRCFNVGPFTRGMSHLYSRTSRQTDEFKIANALVSGHTDPEIVRIVLLGSPHVAYFQETAIRALAFIHEKVMAELATAKDPDAPAGAA